MTACRNIRSVLQSAVMWLLVATVMLGPAGVGGPAASWAASSVCLVCCPCEEQPQRAQSAPESPRHPLAAVDPCTGEDERESESPREREALGDEADEPIDADPSSGDDRLHDDSSCADGCPDCSRCFGAAVAVLASARPTGEIPSCMVALPVTSSRVGEASGLGVFRPPRLVSPRLAA